MDSSELATTVDHVFSKLRAHALPTRVGTRPAESSFTCCPGGELCLAETRHVGYHDTMLLTTSARHLLSLLVEWWTAMARYRTDAGRDEVRGVFRG